MKRYDLSNPGQDGIYKFGSRGPWFRRFEKGRWYWGSSSERRALEEHMPLSQTPDDHEGALFLVSDLEGNHFAHIIEARQLDTFISAPVPLFNEPDQLDLFS